MARVRSARSGWVVLPCAIGVLTAAAASPSPASAQIAGLPVHMSPSGEPGVTLYADFARGDVPGRWYGGGRAKLDLAYVTMTGGVGTMTDESLVWGASLALNLLRGGGLPVALSVMGGYGVNELDATRREFPVGVALALEPLLPGVDLEPWIGLRVHGRRYTRDGPGESDGVLGFGASAGANLRSSFAKNFGLHVAVDWLSVPGGFGTARDRTLTLNVGVHKVFKMPLPTHGIIRPPGDPFSP